MTSGGRFLAQQFGRQCACVIVKIHVCGKKTV